MSDWADYDDNVERVTKAAVEYLLGKEPKWADEKKAARMLLNARSVRIECGDGTMSVTLLYPAQLLEKARTLLYGGGECLNIADAFAEAYYSFTGVGYEPEHVGVSAALWSEQPTDTWRNDVAASLLGTENPVNQARISTAIRQPPFTWNGLGFQSETETRIAKALSEANVLFFPLAAAVAGVQKKEPDFLVCASGKWGILEVQGDKFHPPETAAKEHERGRWFQNYGVKVFQIYSATRCYADPDDVVAEFLKLLRSTG